MSERQPSAAERLIRRLLRRPVHDSDEVNRTMRKLREAQRDQATTFESRLSALNDLVGQKATAKDASEILHAIRALTTTLEASDGSEREARVYKELDEIAKGTRPIVVGPWTGEVGFEVLYWVPFLEWFRTRWRVSADRFVIVSRGGVDAWYGMSGARYVDIFSLMSPDAFLSRTDPDAHKQKEMSPLDEELVGEATRRHRLDSAAHLHPRLMYRVLSPFWKDEAGFGLLERFTSYRRMTPIDEAVPPGLPAEYIAARFYFSDCFPDTAANRALAAAVIEAVSRRLPVVLLDPGVRVDDHADYAPPPSDRVIPISAGLAAERNLAVQSSIVSRARAFVGTYGGYSYLAPFYGVTAVAFYSEQTFKRHHLYAAQRVFERLGSATVLPIDTAQADLVHAVTGIR